MFQRPELEKQLAFLQDFGMQPAEISNAIYLRGHGEAPWFIRAPQRKACFIGAGYNVSTGEDLESFARTTGASIQPVMGRAEGNAQSY